VLKVGRDKDVIKPAKGKRKCNCKQRMVTRQLGPGMFQQYAKEECEVGLCTSVLFYYKTVLLTRCSTEIE
jgi:hypothetical protein